MWFIIDVQFFVETAQSLYQCFPRFQGLVLPVNCLNDGRIPIKHQNLLPQNKQHNFLE